MKLAHLLFGFTFTFTTVAFAGHVKDPADSQTAKPSADLVQWIKSQEASHRDRWCRITCLHDDGSTDECTADCEEGETASCSCDAAGTALCSCD